MHSVSGIMSDVDEGVLGPCLQDRSFDRFGFGEICLDPFGGDVAEKRYGLCGIAHSERDLCTLFMGTERGVGSDGSSWTKDDYTAGSRHFEYFE